MLVIVVPVLLMVAEFGLSGYGSRTYGKIRINRLRVYGNQAAMIFIRSLDSVMVVQLLDIIGKLDATLVIVSQSLLPLISYCDRLAVMVRGEIRACGQKEEILKNERLMREGGVDMDFYRRVYKKYLA